VRRVLEGDLYFSVRLRAAEGLLEAGDSSPVPVLLAVLAEGSPELARRAEDLLALLAEGKGPAPLGSSPAERRKARDAWQTWWEARGGKLDGPAARLSALRANPSRLALKAADRFLRAIIVSPNLAEMRKTTDVPFAVLSDKTYKTRAELDAAFEKEFKSEPNEDLKRLKMLVKYVLRPGEYEKKLSADYKDEREFLRGLRGQPVLIVLVELLNPEAKGTRTEVVPLYIRVRGGDARVIAIGRQG
jgi:hypothetical protein